MGFKVDSSFLRFVTMGALASKRVIDTLSAIGLNPIELERYSTSNKIWATKVKRLRLPDLLCLRTGVRIEVRAKSNLAIKMSDAPNNTQRRWFTSMRRDDLVAFVHCDNASGYSVPCDVVEIFTVGDLLDCDEAKTKLGPPKSAKEGSERDRKWPAIVPTRSGSVLKVTQDSIKTRLDSGRSQTYNLRGLTPYVKPGDKFTGRSQFIAGLPGAKVQISTLETAKEWDPLRLASGDVVDRFVAAKALAMVSAQGHIETILSLMCDEDPRVALEAAGSLAKLGDARGLTRLLEEIANPKEEYLGMEAVLILSELSNSPLKEEGEAALLATANNRDTDFPEIRQAALWGLGKAGFRSYEKLMAFLDTHDLDERKHVLTAFGNEPPETIIRQLVDDLANDKVSDVKRQSISAVLKSVTDYGLLVSLLCEIANKGSTRAKTWAVTTLGLLPTAEVNRRVKDARLLAALAPLQLLSPDLNWTTQIQNQEALLFLSKQNVF